MKDKIKNILNDKNKVGLIIGIGVGVILLIILLLIINSLNRTKVDEFINAVYDEDKPYLVEKDNLYAYLNKDLEPITGYNYSFATPFYFKYALVSADKENNLYTFIGKDGNEVKDIESKKEPKYITKYGIWVFDKMILDKDLNVLYETDYQIDSLGNGYFTYLAPESSGVIDYKGEVIFTWDKTYISASLSKSNEVMEEYALITDIEETEKIISLKDGKVLYENDNAKVTYLREENNNIFRLIDRSNNYKSIKWLYIENNEIKFETEEDVYDIALVDYKDKILKYEYGEGKPAKYYSITKKDFIDYTPFAKVDYVDTMKYKYDYELTKLGKKYGLNKDGKEVLSQIYKSIKFIPTNLFEYIKTKTKEELVLLTTDNEVTIYNVHKNKPIESFTAKDVEVKDGSSFIILTKFEKDGYTKKEYVVYNLITKAYESFSPNSDIKLYSNTVRIQTDNQVSYYNTDLKQITS